MLKRVLRALMTCVCVCVCARVVRNLAAVGELSA